MTKALLTHLLAIPVFALQLLLAIPAEGWRHAWKRLPLFLLFWLIFSLLNLVHMVGHLLDELLFRAYRKQAISCPVFILGIPRSGTTYLQRLFSSDPRFTTFSTWEALLAPSITERYCYRLLGWLLKPLERLVIAIRRRILHDMDNIHAIRLQEPEEDFLLLLPVLACLLPVFTCPRSGHFWRLARFDSAISSRYRTLVLDFYRLCLKKHLYFHGTDKRLLSKNPSFTSWTRSLSQAFPDAKFIACTRAPSEVLPSQLSSLRPAMKVLGKGELAADTQNKMINILHYYYGLLGSLQHEQQIFFLPMTALQSRLKEVLLALLEFMELEPTPGFMATAERAEDKARRYSSGHRYALADFHLTTTDIEQRFADVWPLPTGANDKQA